MDRSLMQVLNYVRESGKNRIFDKQICSETMKNFDFEDEAYKIFQLTDDEYFDLLSGDFQVYLKSKEIQQIDLENIDELKKKAQEENEKEKKAKKIYRPRSTYDVFDRMYDEIYRHYPDPNE